MKKTIWEIFKNHALKFTVTHTVRLRAMRNTNKKKLKPPSALGYLITVNFRTLRVFPMQVLASSCLPQQILDFPSILFTHFDEKAQEFA